MFGSLSARSREMRSLLALTLCSVLVAIVAACGAPQPGASPVGGPTGALATSTPGGAATATPGGAATATPGGTPSLSGKITWWGWSPLQNAAEQYISAFNEVYPDVEVEFKLIQISDYDATLRPALASPVGPDVFDIAPGGGIGSIALYGQNADDIAPVLENALGPDWQSKVSPLGPIDLVDDTGRQVASSIGQTFGGTVWINQDLFTEHNVTPPTTYDEWVEVCQTFRAANQGCFLQGAGQVAFNQDTLQSIADRIEPGWWTKASNGETRWDEPTMVEALTIWKGLFDDGIMDEGALGLQQYPDANNAFLSEKTAMVQMGTWYMQNTTVLGMTAGISGAGIADPQPFTAVPIPFPDVTGEGNPYGLYGNSDYGLAINSKSPNKDLAGAFIAWVTTTADGQQTIADALNEIPSLKGVEPDWANIELVSAEVQQPALEDLIAQTFNSTEPRLSLISGDEQQAIGVASTTVAEGQATPEEAAQTLQTTVESFE